MVFWSDGIGIHQYVSGYKTHVVRIQLQTCHKLNVLMALSSLIIGMSINVYGYLIHVQQVVFSLQHHKSDRSHVVL